MTTRSRTVRCLGRAMTALAVLVRIARADTATSLGDRSGEGAPVFAGLAQTPETNLFTGSLTTRIALELPPGRNGFTPRLALVYASTQGPSAYGFGWDLPLGRVQRSTRWGVPRCDWHPDDFVLMLPDGAVELLADPAGSTTYRPRVETTYIQAEKDAARNTWTVYDRSGTKFVFGDVASARVGSDTSVFMSAGPPCRFTTAWALTHVEDAAGNAMDVGYSTVSNVPYPVIVQYGGNVRAGIAHMYAVRLTYELRPDRIEHHLGGAASELLLRLARVRVTTSVPTASEFRVYTLTYDSAPNGQSGYQSLLSSVSVTGYPTQTFVYTDGLAGHAAQPYTPPPGWGALREADQSGSLARTVMDMDGDGVPDLVRVWPGGWIVHRGGATGPASSGMTWYLPDPVAMDWIRAVRTGADPCRLSDDRSCTERDTFDLTGDGLPDFVDARQTPWLVYPGTGRGFGGPVRWSVPQSYRANGAPVMTPVRIDEYRSSETRTTQDVFDVNGDGLPDFVQVAPGALAPSSPTTWNVYLNTGTGFAATPVSMPAPVATIRRESPAEFGNATGTVNDVLDFNGDGLVDVVVHPQYAADGILFDLNCMTAQEQADYELKLCLDVYLNTGQGFGPVRHVPVPNYTTVIRSRDGQRRVYQDLFDVNGDGLPDYVYAERTGDGRWPWAVLLNRGSTFEPFTVDLQTNRARLRPWTGGVGPLRVTAGSGHAFGTVDLVDFDGDGMLDHVDARATPWTVRRNQSDSKPNLLVAARNGLGGTTTLRYAPSTRFDNTGGDGVPDLPVVTWVPTAMRQTDGLCTLPAGVDGFDRARNPCLGGGHERLDRFAYQDGRFDRTAREFRGFRKVSRVDVDDNAQVTTFGQADATRGKVLAIETYGGTTRFVQRVLNVWDTATTGAGRARVWLAINQVVYDDLMPSTTASTITYFDPPDGYGNIRHSYQTDIFGAGRVDTYSDFAVPVAGSRVYDRPAHTTVTAGGQRLGEKWFLYDGLAPTLVGRGALTAAERWLDQWTGAAPPSCSADATRRCVRVSMAYDAAGNPIRVTDARGSATTTTYDAWGLHPVRVTNALGHVTARTTDYRWGAPLSVTGPNGDVEVTQYAYDAAGRLTCVARPGDANPATDPGVTPPAACSIRYAYTYASQPGQLSSVAVQRKDPGQTATNATQSAGAVATIEYFDALGRHRHRAGFRVVDGVDQTIVTDRVEYDAAGRIASRADPYPMSASLDASVPPDPNNGTTRYEYRLNGSDVLDPLGREHRVTQVDGTARVTLYEGFTTTSFDEEAHKSVVVADHLGRIVQRTGYAGTGPTYAVYATTRYGYDGLGRLVSSTQNGNAATAVQIAYDTLGRRVRLVDPDTGPAGSAGVWRYAYDLAGNLVYQDDPTAFQHTQFCYDALHRLTKKLYFSSDAFQSVDCAASAAATTMTYDTTSDGRFARGRLGLISDTTGTTRFTYDARGRSTSTSKAVRLTVNGITSTKTATVRVAYDGSDADRVSRTTYPDGEVVTTTYDHSGQPLSVVGSTTYVSDARYDVFGRPTTVRHGNGMADVRRYHGEPGAGGFPAGHRLKSLQALASAGALLDLGYPTYTPRGLIAQVTDNRNPALGDPLSNAARFTYDDFARLTDATYNHGPGATPTSYVYAYDPLGNLVTKEGRAFAYDPSKPHQVAMAGGVPVAYDANGNMAGSPVGPTYAFDKDDRLQQVSAAGTAIRLLYDYSGRRVARIHGTSVTRYYNDLVEDTDGALTKYYVLGGVRVAARRVVGVQYAGGPAGLPAGPAVQVTARGGLRPTLLLHLGDAAQRSAALGLTALAVGIVFAPRRRRGGVLGVAVLFALQCCPWPLAVRPLGPGAAAAQAVPDLVHFHLDHVGSTQVVTRADGSVFEHVRYKPFGEVRGYFTASGAVASDCGDDRFCRLFAGYDADPVAGVQYAGARYYDPVLGMFVSRDPVRQFASPYTYTGGNPINLTDPDGAFVVELLVAAVVAAVASSAVSAVIAAAQGARGAQIGQAAVRGAAVGAIGVGLGVVAAGAGIGFASLAGTLPQNVGLSQALDALGEVAYRSAFGTIASAAAGDTATALGAPPGVAAGASIAAAYGASAYYDQQVLGPSTFNADGSERIPVSNAATHTDVTGRAATAVTDATGRPAFTPAQIDTLVDANLAQDVELWNNESHFAGGAIVAARQTAAVARATPLFSDNGLATLGRASHFLQDQFALGHIFPGTNYFSGPAGAPFRFLVHQTVGGEVTFGEGQFNATFRLFQDRVLATRPGI